MLLWMNYEMLFRVSLMRALIFLLFFVISSPSFARDDLPKDIKYLEADEALNNATRQMLISAFESKNFNAIFGGSVVCGPALWNRINNHPKLKDLKLAETTFHIPTSSGTGDGNMQQLKGGFFQTASQVNVFSEILSELPKVSFNVRKISPAEAKIYWKLIPYDIEEPIFAVQYGGLRFIMDVNKGDKKVFWIDEFSRYRVN